MDAQMIVNFVVFALCALLGMWLARRLPAPRNRWVRMALLLLLVIAPAIGPNTRLIDVVFVVYFSVALQGTLFGLAAGWWARK